MRLIAVLLFASLLTADSRAGDPQAKALLETMRKAYTSLHAVHVVARKEDALMGRVSGLISSEYELAEKAGGRYFVEMKQGDVVVISASNGEKTWKALPKAKKWSQVEAAAVVAPSEGSQDWKSRDLHTTVRSMFVGRFPLLAKIGEDAEIVKQEQFKVGKERIPCAVVRMTVESSVHELWIDEKRGLVLQDVQNAKEEIQGVTVPVKTTIKVKEIETDQEVDSGLFDFQPESGWQEVEMLVVPGEEHVSLAGLKAADFHGKLLGGESFELSSLRGKVVVLDFWATWCGPCMRELPSIVKLRQDFAGKAEFLGINDEDSSVVKSFVHKHASYEMPVLMDDKRSVHSQYGVNAIPTLLVIGRDGVIREHFIGSRSEDMIRSAISRAVDSGQ